MIVLKSKVDCSGCTACSKVCPQQCIDMVYDEEGFIYQKTDESRCTNCGICERTCPILATYQGNPSLDCYAVCSKDTANRIASSSGGVFMELALAVLQNGGVVFGASFDEQMRVGHVCVRAKDDLVKLRGSKYVQSNIGDTFVEAETELKQGKMVYFSGTPCQIAGLKAFLEKEDQNLITQDIICHGVPSPMVWSKYVEEKAQQMKSSVVGANFRDKSKGWERFSLQMTYKNGKIHGADLTKDLYLRGFLSDLFLRPSCYACSFKSQDRLGDITLADCWGADRLHVNLPTQQGISLISLNSDKGKNLFEQMALCADKQPLSWQAAITYNSAATKSVPMNPQRQAFFETLKTQKSVQKAMEKNLAKQSMKDQFMSNLSRFKKRLLRG